MLHGVTSFFFSQQPKNTCINISVTVKTIGRISLCDGGKLQGYEGHNYFSVVFNVLESK